MPRAAPDSVMTHRIELGTWERDALAAQIKTDDTEDAIRLGLEIVQAVNSKDYPLAQALFIMMGVIILIMNFIVDMLYCYLDPRVRYE